MRFVLLGDHPDGLEFTRALLATGRHTLHGYSGSPEGYRRLEQWGVRTARSG